MTKDVSQFHSQTLPQKGNYVGPSVTQMPFGNFYNGVLFWERRGFRLGWQDAELLMYNGGRPALSQAHANHTFGPGHIDPRWIQTTLAQKRRLPTDVFQSFSAGDEARYARRTNETKPQLVNYILWSEPPHQPRIVVPEDWRDRILPALDERGGSPMDEDELVPEPPTSAVNASLGPPNDTATSGTTEARDQAFLSDVQALIVKMRRLNPGKLCVQYDNPLPGPTVAAPLLLREMLRVVDLLRQAGLEVGEQGEVKWEGLCVCQSNFEPVQIAQDDRDFEVGIRLRVDEGSLKRRLEVNVAI
ncbi:hypothetical protein MSAN_01673900 [Mycena sanguinolenta]|uniref:Uncharacterized protein n=1 Tax=Mycena sanguinolenta TaxID=230812 RepID=A0A8H7CUN7_9AGAR|nr:hypothetical protein MSAN_01673900 [Mycena sanguinolenta]